MNRRSAGRSTPGCASVFFHFDSSDDDTGGGFFVGGYAGAYYGWRWVKIGPRLLVGRFSEGRPELGVFVAPLTARVGVSW